MVMRRTILYFGALLGVCFLYVALNSLDWTLLAAELAKLHWLYLIPIIATQLCYFAVKAQRWKYMLRPLAPSASGLMLRPVVTGIAGNYLLPHAGEVARSVLASRRLQLPMSALLATVVIERIFDFVALLIITIVTTLPAGRMSPDIRAASWSVGLLAAATLALVVVFLLHKEACLRLAEFLLARVSDRTRRRALRQLRTVAGGFEAITRPGLLSPILLLSMLQWLLILACVILSLASVNVTATLAAGISVLLLNVVALTLPAAPGHIGTVQLAFLVGLAPFGVPQVDAIAGSLVYNVAMVLPALILGARGLRNAGHLLHHRLTK